jgi:CHAT domain-containing protein/Flp pilus assembly protein TadD
MRSLRSTINFALVSLLVPIALSEMKWPIGESAIAQTVPDRQPEGLGKASGDVKPRLEVGKQQFRRAEFKQAIATYQQVIDLAKQRGARSLQAEAMTALGTLYAEIERKPAAEELMLAALKLVRAEGNRTVEADVLIELVGFYIGHQDFKKAQAFNAEAQAVATAAAYPKGITKVKILASIPRWAQLLQQQQFKQAHEVLGEILKLAQTLEEPDKIASVYLFQWLTYRAAGDAPQAERLFAQSQALSQSIGYRLGEYNGFKFAGDATDFQKEPAKQLDYYQRALAISQAADNPWLQRATLLAMGLSYVNQKQTSQALTTYQQALVVAQTMDATAAADVQNQIGVAYYQAAQYPRAITAYEQALKTYLPTQNNQASIAQVWVNIGDVHWQLKQYPKSRDGFQQALAIYQQLKQDSAIGNTQNRIGGVFYRMEQYPKAIAAYQQALAIYQQLNQPLEIAKVWSNIGHAYHWNKQYEQALPAFQQSLKLYQAENRPDAVSQAWKNIGDTYLSQNLTDQALAAYQNALEIARTIPDRALELDALMGQSAADTRKGQRLSRTTAYKDAISAFDKSTFSSQQAQILARELNNVQLERLAINRILINYFGRGLAFRNQQQHVEAIAAFQQGLGFWRQQRNRLPTDEFLREELSTLQQLGSAYSANSQHAQAVTTYQEALPLATQINDPNKQSELLNFLAAAYNRLGNHKKALDASQKLLILAREKLEQNPEREMTALITVGQSLGNLGQYLDQLTHYQQALAIARALKDIGTERTLLSNIGSTYSSQGEYGKALVSLQQALQITQTAIQHLQSGDAKAVEQLCNENYESLGAHGHRTCLESFRYGYGITLNNLALVYDSSGRYAEALKAYEQALEMAQQDKDRDRQTTLFINIGNLNLNIGNYPKALEFSQKALAIAVVTEARPWQASSLNNMGRVYNEQGQQAKALECYQQSLALAQAMQDPELEATALNNMGAVYGDRGDYARALEFYQKSLAIGRKQGLRITTDLNNIANIYSLQGKALQAMELLQQALETARRTGDRPQEVMLLQNMGFIYAQQASYAKALELFQQAQQLSKTMGSRSSELSNLLSQGRVSIDLGQYPHALNLFQQALDLSREIGQKASETVALGNIAAVYREQAQYPQALQYYQQSLTLLQQMGDIAGESSLLQKMAQTYEKQGNVTQAEALLQKSLTIQRNIGARPNEGMTLNTLGRVYTAQGKITKAQAALKQALEIAQSVRDRPTEAQSTANFGALFAQQKQPEVAIAFYKQALTRYEDIRKGLVSLPKDQQQSYTQTVAQTYRDLADLLFQQNRVVEAMQVLDLLKIQELQNFLRNPSSTADRADFDLIFTQEQAIFAALQSTPEGSMAQFTQQPAIQTAISELKTQAIPQSLNLASYKAAQGRIQQFGPQVAMVYPLILSDRLELILMLPGQPPRRHTVNVAKAQLEATIQAFTKRIQDHASWDIQQPAQALHDWLIQPIAADLKAAGITTLVYAPDGQLRYVPLAALYDSKQPEGQRWLVQRYQVNYLTALALTQTGPGLTSDRTILAGAFTQGTTKDKTLSGLAYAEAEVAAIRQNFPQSTILRNQDFNLTTLQSQTPRYNTAHFVTHAAFLVGSPDDSYIVLGDGSKLTLAQLKDWQLPNLNLFVLGACETAVGSQLGNGLEILGFGYQLQLNGVRSSIASLWPVNDQGTQTLMGRFYAALRSQPNSPVAALHAAQLGMMNNPDAVKLGQRQLVHSNRPEVPPSKSVGYSHPFFWAPFILIGNGL